MSEEALFEDPMDLPFKIHGVEEGQGGPGPGIVGAIEIHIFGGGPPQVPCMADCLTNPPTSEMLVKNLAKEQEFTEHLEKLKTKLLETPPTQEDIEIIKKLVTTKLKILRIRSLLS
jgi:hypothetical protein